MPAHRRLAVAVSLLALVANAHAQQIDLPGGTGRLTPAAEWTVLRAPDFALAERPSDPKDEFARAMLITIIDEARQRKLEQAYVVLHAAGPAGELRLVSAQRAEFRTRRDDLSDQRYVDGLRDGIVSRYEAGGVKVKFVGHVDPQLWTAGSLRVRFDMQTEAFRWYMDMHQVPAGNSTLLFQTVHLPADAGAEAAIDALLRTFDGAKIVSLAYLLGRLTGMVLVAGVIGLFIVWTLRRSRSERADALDESGSEPDAG